MIFLGCAQKKACPSGDADACAPCTDPSGPNCPGGARGGEQRECQHPELVPGEQQHVAVSERGQAPLHSHAGIPSPLRPHGVPQIGFITQVI